MEVYVDEVPKSCYECCFECDGFCCIDNEYVIDEYFRRLKHEHCPLKLISEVKKQERERVLNEVEKHFTEYLTLKDKTGAGFYAKLNKLKKAGIVEKVEEGE